MKRLLPLCASLVTIALLGGAASAQDASKTTGASKLVYADFQNLQDGRPVSSRGGITRLNRYSQNSANPPGFRGLEKAEPPAPAPARVTDTDTAAAFEYDLRIPNEWAGVNMEIFGQPEKDG